MTVSTSKIADSVHRAISKVTNEAHFSNLIDWVEIHRPGLMLSKSVIGLGGGPTLVISSGRSFPVAELDFGFGGPVLGTVGSTIERLGVGYMNQRQSEKKDGSWIISAILWPEMVEALESDPDHIFQPMRINHIQLKELKTCLSSFSGSSDQMPPDGPGPAYCGSGIGILGFFRVWGRVLGGDDRSEERVLRRLRDAKGEWRRRVLGKWMFSAAAAEEFVVERGTNGHE
ncbi:HXXXD-type acyl-transferase family protein [Striga asiatica]|uniref:HXXXD-type acyl-transferase family protein n=1 Tax=Striga asiatica TaxID=4170 RepID=A0A5A7PC41_STRAF|nr:HXXXD-type acyl-transferase family protein [Striga asiatica]